MTRERYRHDVILGRFVVHAPFQRKGRRYWIVRYRDLGTGETHEVNTRQTTAARARRWAHEHLVGLVELELDQVDEPVAFARSIREWLAYVRHDLAASTVADLERRVESYVERWGTLEAHELAARDLQDFLAELAAAGRTVKTRRNHVAYLRLWARWARTRGHVGEDPTEGVELPRGGAFEARRLTPEEARRLVRATRAPHVRLAVLLALYAALRRGNVLGLEWRHVDLESGWITIPAAEMKARRAHRVPLHPVIVEELRAELARLGRQPAPTAPVIGRRVKDLKTGWRAAIRRAGLPEEVRFHDLRGTCATWLRRRAPIDVVTAMLGHAQKSVAGRHYVDLDEAEIASAVASLPDIR